jgi:hypothetical protein
MELNEAVKKLKDAGAEVQDFKYTLKKGVFRYVIFPTLEDFLKCYGLDPKGPYAYEAPTEGYTGYIYDTTKGNYGVIKTVENKTKSGYWMKCEDFIKPDKYNVEESYFGGTQIPMISRKSGPWISFETFLKRRDTILAQQKAYDDYKNKIQSFVKSIRADFEKMADAFNK